MNPYRIHTRCIALIAAFGPLASAPAWAAAKDCWLDVFDKTDFQGAKVHIEGPSELPTLTKLEGRDWSDRIESLAVGANASVTAYRNEHFKLESEEGPPYHGEALKAWGEKPEAYGDQAITIGPGKKEHHLGELHFHQNIKSLKIECLP